MRVFDLFDGKYTFFEKLQTLIQFEVASLFYYLYFYVFYVVS